MKLIPLLAIMMLCGTLLAAEPSVVADPAGQTAFAATAPGQVKPAAPMPPPTPVVVPPISSAEDLNRQQFIAAAQHDRLEKTVTEAASAELPAGYRYVQSGRFDGTDLYAGKTVVVIYIADPDSTQVLWVPLTPGTDQVNGPITRTPPAFVPDFKGPVR